MRYLIILSTLFLLSSCGQSNQIPFDLKEAMNRLNNPTLIPGSIGTLEYTLSKLPDTGQVTRLWSGPWWPLSEGGTSSTKYGTPSPLKKYDQAVGSDANDWEIENSRKYATVGWSGHCNGLAAASVMMEQPSQPVLYKGIQFTVTDIKALLTEMWQASGYIVGDRCDRSTITYDRYGRIVESECRDVNPATLHMALTNYLGRFGKAIVGDKDPSEAVWNYPIQSYEVLEKTEISRSEASYRIQSESSDVYTYNSQAVAFAYIKISVTFLGFSPNRYEYVLELDQKGQILGGEWTGTSKRDHPDFIWRPIDPKTENPYLDLNVIRDIYKKSI